MLGKYVVKMWSESIWLKMRTSGGLLRIR